MDKIKQNIDLQEAIQRYNIEKSVVGTLAYSIEQNIQKGMSPDEAIENVLQKSKSMPIGTIHNGFKKIAEGKWRKVSEHGMTQREHKDTAYKHEDAAVRTKPTSDKGEDDRVYAEEYKAKKHKELASKLDSKDYSDEEVTGGEKKDKNSERKSLEQERKVNRQSYENKEIDYDTYSHNERKIDRKFDKVFKKSFPESTLSKSEQTEAQKAKVKKVMDEWKAGKLKSSSGEKVVSQSQALAIAMSEAGIEIKKGVYVNDAENRKLGRVGQHYGESNASKSDEEVTGEGEKNIVEYRDEFIKTSKSPSVTKTLETKVKYDNGIRTKAENIEKLAQNGIFSERNIEHDRIKASKDHPDAFYTAGGYMREIDKESYILDGYYCSKTEFEYSKFLQNKLK
jgi:hypothetical protein